MIHRHRPAAIAVFVGLIALALAGCETTTPAMQPAETAAPTVVPTLPPAFPPHDLVGGWGLAAYHKEADRERTIKAAGNQCRNPYVITLGPSGGVMMHLADHAQPSELALKGAPGGKTYIGPSNEPPGANDDREVVSFTGRVLILRWMDPEVQGRYGTMVYVRCAPEGGKRHVRHTARHSARPKPAARPRPEPKPVQPPIQQGR